MAKKEEGGRKRKITIRKRRGRRRMGLQSVQGIDGTMGGGGEGDVQESLSIA